MCDLAIFVMNRNVDFMGFLTFQLLMKLGDFDLALVLIRQNLVHLIRGCLRLM